jgi:hypothetical protein
MVASVKSRNMQLRTVNKNEFFTNKVAATERKYVSGFVTEIKLESKKK